MTNGFRGNHPTAHAGIFTIQDEKAALRHALRTLRRQLAVEEVDRLSRLIHAHLLSSDLLLHASSIGLYLPIDNEVNTLPLLQLLWESGKKLFVPVARENRTMGFFPLLPEDTLLPSPMGIREPPTVGRPERNATELELLLLPLIGFDPAGNRLGFGGGYFDRWLATLGDHTPQTTPWRIGLAYSFQETPRLPVEPHDRPLHGVVTEQGLRMF